MLCDYMTVAMQIHLAQVNQRSCATSSYRKAVLNFGLVEVVLAACKYSLEEHGCFHVIVQVSTFDLWRTTRGAERDCD
jgi:hypothetical protein